MEEPYSKRELDLILKPVHDKLDGMIDDLKEIKDQTTKHNGRMTKLEDRTKDYEDIKKMVIEDHYWRKYVIIGAGIVAAIVLALPRIFPDFDPLGIHRKVETAIQDCIKNNFCTVIEE